MSDRFDDLEDDDEEAFLAAWAAADRHAAAVLREALPKAATAPAPQPDLHRASERLRQDLAAPTWPFTYFDAACEWKGEPPADDARCYVEAVTATISPRGEPDWPAEDQAAVMTVENGDWAGAVIGLVRAGPRSAADPAALIDYIDRCPEIEGAVEPDDELVLGHAFEVLMPLWQAISVVDEDRCVTRLGIWALPLALLAAWDPQR